MSELRADAFPAAAIRARAQAGVAAAFPDLQDYGLALFGADPDRPSQDGFDHIRLVPPVFVPRRLVKLIELAREPTFADVDLTTVIGGLPAALPLYLSALGSTRVASVDLALAASGQAGRLGIPMVVGENVLRVNGSGRGDLDADGSLLARISAYVGAVPDGLGGVVIQQSTEDADAEVWNLIYSDPEVFPLLESGRLAFELKVGQGAKPGLGGMTLLDPASAAGLTDAFTMTPLGVGDAGTMLRSGTPGTFTEEILRQQVRLMRNNFPRARVWVKLPPARDVAAAAAVAWDAGADAVTVDGAEGGTGWAPTAFVEQVGLPLVECLRRLDAPTRCLLVSGRMWEGGRVAKSLALGATAAGLGRAALIAVDVDPHNGLINLVQCLAFELQLLASALGKYSIRELAREDLFAPGDPVDRRLLPDEPSWLGPVGPGSLDRRLAGHR